MWDLKFLNSFVSFFVHADFLTAFKAAPQGFWDYFHKSYPRHPIEQDKGYGREWFDCQIVLVKKAEEKAFAKMQILIPALNQVSKNKEHESKLD